MIHITTTQTYGSIEAVIEELNKLPEHYRDYVIEFKSYDGWRPKHFKFINGTFERVALTMEGLLS